MEREIVLTEGQVVEIKKLADNTRKAFGIFGDVPITKDIFMLLEKKADRFAAELLLPDDILHSRVVSQFKSPDLSLVTELQLLRFIARLQGEWGLPYRSILFRIWALCECKGFRRITGTF